MSETSPALRRALYLIVEGFPEERLGEIAGPASNKDAEIFRLTAENAKEALEKIFAADSVSVWGKVP